MAFFALPAAAAADVATCRTTTHTCQRIHIDLGRLAVNVDIHRHYTTAAAAAAANAEGIDRLLRAVVLDILVRAARGAQLVLAVPRAHTTALFAREWRATLRRVGAAGRLQRAVTGWLLQNTPTPTGWPCAVRVGAEVLGGGFDGQHTLPEQLFVKQRNPVVRQGQVAADPAAAAAAAAAAATRQLQYHRIAV